MKENNFKNRWASQKNFISIQNIHIGKGFKRKDCDIINMHKFEVVEDPKMKESTASGNLSNLRKRK